MTLHSLDKILGRYEQQLCSSSIQQFELLKGLPFYDWNSTTVNNSSLPLPLESRSKSELLQQPKTFNHVIGLPEKNGLEVIVIPL